MVFASSDLKLNWKNIKNYWLLIFITVILCSTKNNNGFDKESKFYWSTIESFWLVQRNNEGLAENHLWAEITNWVVSGHALYSVDVSLFFEPHVQRGWAYA